MGNFDSATNEARIYLRLAKDAKVLSELSSKIIIREAVSRAFLLLTSAYSELGARTYSKRILEYALNYDLVEEWKKVIISEISRIKEELSDSDNMDTNRKWEDFFDSGKGAESLYKSCYEKGFPIMKKRIDLIEGNFRFNSSFKIDENEIFLLVFEGKKGSFLA